MYEGRYGGLYTVDRVRLVVKAAFVRSIPLYTAARRSDFASTREEHFVNALTGRWEDYLDTFVSRDTLRQREAEYDPNY